MVKSLFKHAMRCRTCTTRRRTRLSGGGRQACQLLATTEKFSVSEDGQGAIACLYFFNRGRNTDENSDCRRPSDRAAWPEADAGGGPVGDYRRRSDERRRGARDGAPARMGHGDLRL